MKTLSATLLVAQIATGSMAFGYSPDLIYYSKMDSSADITSPQVGAAGTINGVAFQEGKVGNALYVAAASDLVTIPFASGFGSKGTIEFFAKILNSSNTIKDHSDPNFWTIRKTIGKTAVMAMHFSSNNGAGQQGVCFGPLYGGGGATSEYKGGTSYGEVLGYEDPKGWHSYRIVWNEDGINESGDAIGLYIDGVLRGSAIKDSGKIDSFISSLQPSLFLVFGDKNNQSPFLIDEFKVWKTDTPSEDPSPVELPVVSDVTAQQHYPWCGKIDIGYTVAGSTGGLLVKISVKDNDNDVTYEAKTFDVTPSAAAGTHTVVWDATKDGVNKVSKNMVATVSLIVPAE